MHVNLFKIRHHQQINFCCSEVVLLTKNTAKLEFKWLVLKSTFLFILLPKHWKTQIKTISKFYILILVTLTQLRNIQWASGYWNVFAELTSENFLKIESKFSFYAQKPGDLQF